MLGDFGHLPCASGLFPTSAAKPCIFGLQGHMQHHHLCPCPSPPRCMLSLDLLLVGDGQKLMLFLKVNPWMQTKTSYRRCMSNLDCKRKVNTVGEPVFDWPEGELPLYLNFFRDLEWHGGACHALLVGCRCA